MREKQKAVVENQNRNTNVSPVADGVTQTAPPSGFVVPEPLNDTEALSQYAPTTLAEPTVSEIAPKSPGALSHVLKRLAIALGILLAVALVIALGIFFSKRTQQNSSSVGVSKQYNTQQISLSGISVTAQGLSLAGGKVVINGPMTLNEGVVITPSVQPNSPVTGQLYYDQNTNQLAYYNGAAFVPLTASGQVVQSIGGATGQLTLGGGLNVVGNQLSVVFPATAAGVSSFGGKTGAITVGSGLALAGNELQNKGVLNILAGTNIAVTNDGAGNYTVINTGAGTGTVTSSGGTNGTIPLFTASQNIENSIITQSGLTVTVTGDLSIVTGGLSLSNALTVSNGGTGATSLAANGVIVGNGTAALSSVATGSAGLCLVSTAGAPTWAACPGGSGVTTLNGLSGALSIANASAAGSTVTIDDASTTNKGIASFNSTNFTAASGAVNTVQNINTGATPTFAGLNTNIITPSAAMTVGATTQTLLLQGSTATITSTGAGNNIILNSANTIELQDNTNITGNLDVSGTLAVGTANALQVAADGTLTTAGVITAQGGSVTAGVALQAGNLIISDGSNNTGTIQTAALGQNTVYTLPDPGSASVNICLSSGNCAGSGSGVTTAGGTLNRLAKFSAAQAIADSTITDNGTTVTTSVNLVVQGGTLTMGVASSQTGSINFAHSASAFTGTVVQGALTNNRTYTLADSSGTFCMSSGNCAGSGSPYTLQAAYDAGNTVTTTTNRDIAFTLADTTADSNFTITTATNSSGTVSIVRADGTGTVDPAQLLLLDNLDADRVQPIGLKIQAAGGGMTTAVDVSDPEIVDAINVGANNVVGTTGDLNFTNFDVTGSTGTITSVGNAILQGGTITVGTITQAGGVVIHDGSNNTGTIQTAALGQNTVYTLPDPGSASVNICLSSGNCAGSGTGVTTTGGTIGTIPVFTASQQIADSLLSQAAGTVTVAGNLNLTTGSQYQINGSQISSANLSNDSNLAKLSASQTFTGNTVAFQNGSNSVNAFNIQNSTGNRILTVDTSNAQILLGLANTLDGKLVFSNVSNANTVTIQPGTPTANRTLTLPDASGIICTDSGNCAGAGATLQTGYNFSIGGTTPKIKVDSTRLGVDIQDADVSIAADLLDVRASNGSGLGSVMFGVGSTGQITMQNSANSTTALRLLTQGGTSVATIDTTNGQAILGQGGTLAGTLVLSNATNTNKTTLISSTATADRTITLPNETGTVCTTGSICTGYASSSGSGSYIWNGTSLQTNANIAIQSAADTSITLLIRQRPTQSADTLRIEDSSSNPYLRVDGYGGFHISQSSSLDGAVGIGGMGASAGEMLRIGTLNATDIGLNIYGNGSQTADLLRITAGGVQPILAIGGSGQAAFQNRTNSTTALTVSNASSQNIFGVDTTNSQVVLGVGGTLAGSLVFSNATNTNKTTLVSSAATADRIITLPNETGTVCTTGSICTGYAASSGSGSYIQNQNASQQATSNYWISGTGRADTSLQSPLLDTATATALAIGTTNATAINLNQNTVIAATKTLTVTSGLTSLTGGATGDALNVNSTSTGNVALFMDNSTAVLTITDGGSTFINTTTNSTTAFTVQGTAALSVMTADTFNNTAHLRTVYADNTSTFDSIWLQGNKNGVSAFIGGNDNVNAYTANELSGNLRFNGSNLAWGDFGYYPTGGGDGNYGQFRLSTTGLAINTTPNAKLGVGDLYVANKIGINNTSPTEALDVSGNINIGSANSYKIGGVIAAEASGSYLRINQANQFSNGIYTGTSGIRIGGTTGLLVGSAGSDGQIGLIPSGADNTRRITLDGGTGAIQGYTEVLSGATSGDALSVSNSTSTGNIVVFKDNSTAVATIANEGATTFQNSTDSTAAFRVLNAAALAEFTVDTTNARIKIGSDTADTTGITLVLDSKSSAGDPAGVNGAMYYNVAQHQYRCYRGTNSTAADGAWETCGINPIDRGFALSEEFLGGTLASSSGYIGELGWGATGSGGGWSYNDSAYVSPTADHPGVLEINSAGVGTGYNLMLNGSTNDATQNSMVLAPYNSVKASLILSNYDGYQQTMVGLYDRINYADSTTTGVYWKALDPLAGGTAYWRYCYINGAGTEVCANSGVTLQTTTTTYASLGIRINALGTGTSNVTYTINGNSYTVSGVTVNATNNVNPAFAMYVTSSTGGGTYWIGVDYFQLSGVSSARR